MYQNKLSTKAFSFPFKPEFSGTPLVEVGDIPIANVDHAEADKLVRKWRKQQIADGVVIFDTFAAAVYAEV